MNSVVFLFLSLITISFTVMTRADEVKGNNKDSSSSVTSPKQCSGKLCLKCAFEYENSQKKKSTTFFYGKTQSELIQGCRETYRKCQLKMCECTANCPIGDQDGLGGGGSNKPQCGSPRDCGEGGTCIDGKCYNSPTECRDRDDCAPGKKCIAGQCRD